MLNALNLFVRRSSQLTRSFNTRSVLLSETARTDVKSFKKEFEKNLQPGTTTPNFTANHFDTSEEKPNNEKITFNLYLPYKHEVKNVQADLVLIPAVTGDFGVMHGHVPTIAQLRPGVVTVHEKIDSNVTKLFVSSGFAFVHADSSADIVALEAFKTSEIDFEVVSKKLEFYQSNLANNQEKSDMDSATAQIGVEVFSALKAAADP